MCCQGSKGRSPAAIIQLPQVVESADNSLKGLALTFPIDDGVERKFGRPKVLADGSIEYRASVEHPPEINGYARDASNPCLFRPLWPACQLRMQGTKMDRNTGAIDVSMVCTCSEAAKAMLYVSVPDCEGCPFRR